MKRMLSLFLVFILALVFVGCEKTPFIPDSELEGTWYSTVSATNTITFNLEDKVYISDEFFVSGRFKAKRNTGVILTDSFGDTHLLTPVQTENGTWELRYDNPYFPLVFTKIPPEVSETPESETTYDTMAVIGETILEILNAGEWKSEGTAQVLFDGRTIICGGREPAELVFASVQIVDSAYHFTATANGGEYVGRITPASTVDPESKIPDSYILDLLYNGAEYIRGTLYLTQ